MADNYLTILQHLRDMSGAQETEGLDDETIARFCSSDAQLVQAINEASEAHKRLVEEFGMDVMSLPESELIPHLQEDYVNFYAPATVNPYIPIAGRGPWLVTSSGAVLHDNGGYGMLGSGHGPDSIIKAMSQNWVMANVMTPSFSQKRLGDRLRKELGHARGHCPFDRFICMNSGSESVSIGARLADVNAKELTAKGAKHFGKSIARLTLSGSFHGRTDRPAQFSDSTRSSYKKHLKSFENKNDLFTVTPNDIDELKEVFKKAEKENIFIEAFFMEPVMGEGNPGQAISPEFYDEARKLTKESGTLLLIDSIQAGLRAQGVLSIIDYPGFENSECPDMETYSKALNAGQYPLSVLAMTGKAAELYRQGIYGNTMTSNPKALDVASAVIKFINPEIRKNIRDRGLELVEKLNALSQELKSDVTNVQGTGLLASSELSEEYKCYGENSTEEYLRKNGLGVIHGGINSLRYTPYFLITSEEVDLIVDLTREALINGPKKQGNTSH